MPIRGTPQVWPSVCGIAKDATHHDQNAQRVRLVVGFPYRFSPGSGLTTLFIIEA